ncbi:MAG: NAD(P)/FAD-dependent oxidoreductase [Candidatus Dormibacteraeota bacterium]|nr:NAD(P)/FAD-dependent oxidoreductase [Candidatus Dormibacteraeota bacterium]
MAQSHEKPRVVIVGAGFAGYNAAHELARLAGATAEIVVINPADYFLYLPLMPQVAGGLIEPRHICISLPGKLSKVRFVLGEVNHIDFERRVVGWASPEGGSGETTYDRLILTAGSVNKLLPIPGVAEYAHGFRSIAEAFYLRDHITRQLELAAVAGDPAERQARCTFVVVGAGYTGTEVAALGQLMTTRLARRIPGLGDQHIRWLLLDTAPRLLPELDQHLGRTADRVLRRRGVEVRTGQSVAEARQDHVLLSTGEKVPTRSLIWCVGVRPDHLAADLGLATNRGRLVVDEFMSVPGVSDLYACGDCAAVPDLTRPGQLCGMTAQHASRQGKRVAKNVAASLGIGRAAPYKHPDLGFLVDLGGFSAACNPLHVPISGLPANAITRAYHLDVMAGNRSRVFADWALNVISPQPPESLALVSSESVPLDVEKARAFAPTTAAPVPLNVERPRG